MFIVPVGKMYSTKSDFFSTSFFVFSDFVAESLSIIFDNTSVGFCNADKICSKEEFFIITGSLSLNNDKDKKLNKKNNITNNDKHCVIKDFCISYIIADTN